MEIVRCDSWDDGKLLEEHGDKVLGLLGGEGRKFFKRFPLILAPWFGWEKHEDGRTLCFGLSWGLGESDLGDMELGECSGELARGGDGIERGLNRILYWRFVWKYSRYYCVRITIIDIARKWEVTVCRQYKFLLLRKPGLGDESCNLDAAVSAAKLLKIGLFGWTGVQYLLLLLELSSNPSSRYSDPELSLGGLILGRTCWKALEPDELELCFKTSSWSLISWTLSWMLLKADFGRELLLFFTAEGNL